MKKIVWCFKQFFPLTYRSHFERDSKPYFSVWRMWFGRCFSVEEFQIVK